MIMLASRGLPMIVPACTRHLRADYSAPGSADTGLGKQAGENFVRVEVFPRHGAGRLGVQCVVAPDGTDRLCRLRHRADREQPLPRGEEVCEPRGLEHDRPPGRQVTGRAVAEPATAVPHIPSLGTAELTR